MCCLLGTIPLLKSCRQSIGSQLTTGASGWVTPDSPGQPHMLLGRAGLAERAQGPSW